MVERAYVFIFDGKRGAEGLYGLERYVAQIAVCHEAGGGPIFLAGALTPVTQAVFGTAAGVNFAGRGAPTRAEWAEFSPDG
jgi:hypothetical protein